MTKKANGASARYDTSTPNFNLQLVRSANSDLNVCRANNVERLNKVDSRPKAEANRTSSSRFLISLNGKDKVSHVLALESQGIYTQLNVVRHTREPLVMDRTPRLPTATGLASSFVAP